MKKIFLLLLTSVVLAACSPNQSQSPTDQTSQPVPEQTEQLPVVPSTPLPEETLTDLIEQNAQLSDFLTALQVTGFDEIFDTDGPFTILVPNNQAFNAIPEKSKLLQNPSELVDILKYHTLAGSFSAEELAQFTSAGTLLPGRSVSIQASGSAIIVNGNNVVEADIPAQNGRVYILDTVLIAQ